MAPVKHFYLIHTKPDGNEENLGLFKTFQEACEVMADLNEDLSIPVEEMIVIEKIEDVPLHKDNPVDNQE